MPPSVEIWFVVVSNNTDGMGPCFAIWMYSAANLRKKFYVIHPPRASPGACGARGDAAPAREAKSALRERDALPSRSLSLQYSRRRRA